MKGNKRSLLFWLSLLGYGVLLSGALLYVRYPAAKVEMYLAARLSALAYGAVVDIGHCGYQLPLRLSCEDVRFTEDGSGDELFVVDAIGISPKFAGLRLLYRITGSLEGGTFEADARFLVRQGILELSSLTLTGLDLSATPAVQKGMQRQISGLLDFLGSMSLGHDGIIAQQGKITIRDGELALRQQILQVERMQMAPLAVDVVYDAGKLRLDEGSIRGSQLLFTFAGEVATAGEMANWDMKIAGTVVPVEEFAASNPLVQRIVRRLQRQYPGEVLPYALSGSLRIPRFRFGER